MTLKEDDLVLCTVKKIEGTTVFLDVEGNGEGSMVFSEVAPGRIRNMREFIVPNKKVVCKVLRIRDGHPELSLRRVTTKEKEEVIERHKKENTLKIILRPIVKEKTDKVIAEIAEKYELSDFVELVREKPAIIKEFVSKGEAEALEKIFVEKKEKEKEVKKTITVKTLSSSGLYDLQKTLEVEESNIRYLGSSKFLITVKGKDFKLANNKLESILQKIKENGKKEKVVVEVK